MAGEVQVLAVSEVIIDVGFVVGEARVEELQHWQPGPVGERLATLPIVFDELADQRVGLDDR